jgi:hypothetical protein
MRRSLYVNLLIAEWGVEKRSPKVLACMRRVLAELSGEAQLTLRKNPKLQVLVLPEAAFSVWAYFPVHRRRTVVSQLAVQLNPTARVLLVISEKHLEQQSVRKTNAELRDHLGHVLLYLRSPKKQNDCDDALREWQESVRKNTD